MTTIDDGDRVEIVMDVVHVSRYEMLFLGCEPCKACPG